ncbi:hypothetical protein SteCoe_13105 [Stentor coeruleus]|uniref:Uncharacterized protein n=1 Tax=Stentor coeruleus TaxID=5963 RepID=A0A1R2C978_9CILI|nr:hypothetical protein SteCoe_13105 [Stentor coeruleus]
MGCLESSTLKGAEIEFIKTRATYGTLIPIKIENHENEEDIKIDENALCDENNTETITFTTRKNDISSLTRTEIGEKADIISKLAIQKILERKDEDKEVKNIAFDKRKFNRRLSKQVQPIKIE